MNTPAAKIAPELAPILKQLQEEGHDVYTYESIFDTDPKEITSLYWYENGRVLDIQPTHWRNARYARDLFRLCVSYKPSSENGNACGLSPEEGMGTPANELLQYRTFPTWVHGAQNYASIEQCIKDHRPLAFYKIEEE